MAGRILLHICCGPCAIAPVKRLQEAGWTVVGLFYNPNIQPAMEYLRRREGVAAVAGILDVAVRYDAYDPLPHLRRSLADPAGRCPPCWDERLDRAAATARALGCDAFTSSLLYSKYQDHDLLAALGDARAQAHGVPFHYRDFRVHWDEGVALSREWNIYRQPYCGCLLSELDRYAKKLRQPPVGE
ncbi:MAG: epoxyqueuosine reductase QueH [Solidesulfovibrio sp.]|uniref:epoxyqueuosine reductase QueH n=1 Tax=Solidesulfovibrio sp. TaxID=2910990 RepID=UPI0031584E04